MLKKEKSEDCNICHERTYLEFSLKGKEKFSLESWNIGFRIVKMIFIFVKSFYILYFILYILTLKRIALSTPF